MKAEVFLFSNSDLSQENIQMTEMQFRTGKRIYLRPFKVSDTQTLQKWMNDWSVTQYLGRVLPTSEREELAWIENQGKSKSDIVLAIVTREGDNFIGCIGLHNINWVHRTAISGTILGEEDRRGKGYGPEAKMLLLDLAFNALDLYGVVSQVMENNVRSLAYGKKSGYVEVGRIPKWLRSKTGERCDEVLLLITQEKWRPLWNEYLNQTQASDT